VLVAERRQLAHPPIKEALLNIQISPEMPLVFAQTVDRAWTNCDKKQPIHRGHFQFQLGAQLASLGSQELMGIRCDSDDGRFVTQVRRDGITLSIVRDYRDWDELEARTLEVWNGFLNSAGPVRVSQIATRFINVMRLPASNIEFDDYLTAAPRVPPGLPNILGEFFQRILIPMRPDLIAVVIQALDAPAPDAISVILDIDVQLSCSVTGNLSDIQPLINSLRSVKDDVFFSSVTEKALEGY
jgi:uncharacterized protein (TIGR04255 family)